MRIISSIFFFIVIALLFFLAYLNSEVVHFDYLVNTTELPLSLLLLFCFLTGVVFTALSVAGIVVSLNRKLDKLNANKSKTP